MQFTPKTEEQIQEENLLPDGVYPFACVSAEEKLSKKGNPMIVAELLIYKEDGGTWKLTDYLMEAMAFKLRHFCFFCGLEDKYNAGVIDVDDLANVEGYVEIGTQKAQGAYGPKNQVVDYVAKPEPGATTKPKPTTAKAQANELGDDDLDSIPF